MIKPRSDSERANLRVHEQDIPFANPDGEALKLRLYQPPVGARLGHAIVMIHGGAWSTNHRKTPAAVNRHLAARGLTVFSLDFRDGRNGKHPCAVQDITAGIRFVRAHAARFEVDAARIGLIGSSSGGHLALLAGLQPDIDPHRGTRIYTDAGLVDPTSISAEVSYLIALWPVSDPLRRYEHAKTSGRDELIAAHRAYFVDEAHMARASVQGILADGGADRLPPLLVVQPGDDQNVPPEMTLDLLLAVQRRQGDLQYLHYPGLPHAFAYEDSPSTRRLVDDLWPFIQRFAQSTPDPLAKTPA